MKLYSHKYSFDVQLEPFLLRPNVPVAGEAVPVTSSWPLKRLPNTIAAHALIQYARTHPQLSEEVISTQLYELVFSEGMFLDAAALVKLGARHGLSSCEVKKVIGDERRLAAVRQRSRDWMMAGVKKIPCFYVNGHRPPAGLQDKHKLLQLFDKVALLPPLPLPLQPLPAGHDATA